EDAGGGREGARTGGGAPPLAPLASHQPPAARDAASLLERGGVGRGQGRVHEGARGAERDQARGFGSTSPYSEAAPKEKSESTPPGPRQHPGQRRDVAPW